jgi:hypothetical protein
MELNELLAAMDATAANLEKLDQVWSRAHGMIPTSPGQGSSREYDDLRRVWVDLLPGLPQIDGWTVTTHLPDADEIGLRFVDEWSSGEQDPSLGDDIERPGKALSEYRYRLNKARRAASRMRLQALEEIVESNMPKVLADVARSSADIVNTADSQQVEASIKEIDRLMGDATERRGRWGDLHRHLAFGQGHDWHDISEFDWPSVKEDIAAACYSENDPLPVPAIDLGTLASSNPAGSATTALAWDAIDAAGFERLLFDLFKSFSKYQNVQWLTKTQATDRGRDLSAELVLDDGTGGVRTERIIIQAKHWATKSVGLADVNDNLAAMRLWEPPTVRTLIIATSGHFSTDAVDWVERHNAGANVPTIELWPQSRLEYLLAQKPHLIASHGLRA